MPHLELGDLDVEVVLKDIKNLHLRVYPPSGHVRISAPRRMSLDRIRAFALSKLDWIRRRQAKLREEERQTRFDYRDQEIHQVWGEPCVLVVSESDEGPTVELKEGRLFLRVEPQTGKEKRKALIEAWYRQELGKALPPLLARWQPLLGVNIARVSLRQMKTLWGSCSPKARTLRINTELAKKPVECLEYIVVHELTHLMEPSHNARFARLMDRSLPRWRDYRKVLNHRPVTRGA